MLLRAVALVWEGERVDWENGNLLDVRILKLTKNNNFTEVACRVGDLLIVRLFVWDFKINPEPLSSSAVVWKSWENKHEAKFIPLSWTFSRRRLRRWSLISLLQFPISSHF